MQNEDINDEPEMKCSKTNVFNRFPLSLPHSVPYTQEQRQSRCHSCVMQQTLNPQ